MNPGLLHCWQTLYHLSHPRKGSPRKCSIIFKEKLLYFQGLGNISNPKLNPGLLHFRQSLYCLSQQGDFKMEVNLFKIVAVVQSLSCVRLCHPNDYNTPGFPVLPFHLQFIDTLLSLHWRKHQNHYLIFVELLLFDEIVISYGWLWVFCNQYPHRCLVQIEGRYVDTEHFWKNSMSRVMRHYYCVGSCAEFLSSTFTKVSWYKLQVSQLFKGHSL